MHAVLVDTGPLYALSISSDQYHQRARKTMDQIQRENMAVIVPYPTLMETYSLLLRCVSPVTAHHWLEEIQEQVSIITPTGPDFEAATHLATRYENQVITLFDALLAVLSGEFTLPVWTFDHHFDILQVEVWR